MSQINLQGDTIAVNFRAPFDLETYQIFLQSKQLPECNLAYDWETDSYQLRTPARFAHFFGLEAPRQEKAWLPFNPQLFDYERWIVQDLALPAKRFAIWCDTGLGKAFMMLELARQVLHKTQGRILMVVPLNLIQQTVEEAIKFYGDAYPEIIRLQSRRHLETWCTGEGPGLAVINPEKFIPRKGEPETISACQWLAGVLLDEASILKTGGGIIKWALIHSCRGIEYKYTFTATPAPNETMEYASQGSFLEKLRHEGEIIWTFFTRTKDGDWKIKDHARAAFYRFLAGWSIYMRDPARYGFQDHLQGLPRPIIREYPLEMTPEQRRYVQKIPDAAGQAALFGSWDKLEMVHRIKYSELAKGFLYQGEGPGRQIIPVPSLKPQFCADLALQDLSEGLKVLIWTVFDEESRILFDLLKNSGYRVEMVTGSLSKAARLPIIERFRKGESDCLITKAQLLGYGLNFQVCGSNIISGFTDSEEQRYQLERRSYRYGQTRAVKMHYPFIPELEGVVLDNINQKRMRFLEEVQIMEENYIRALRG
ncbi:MAG: helicase-related protein [Candidatus Cryosericum sp.]